MQRNILLFLLLHYHTQHSLTPGAKYLAVTASTAVWHVLLTQHNPPHCLRKQSSSPVKNCRNVDVQVHSGLPSLREKRHSRCRMEPGNTARSPDGSTDAEPDGILISTVGGESSANETNYDQTHCLALQITRKSLQFSIYPSHDRGSLASATF